MKKALVLILIAVFAVSCLAACTDSSNQTQETQAVQTTNYGGTQASVTNISVTSANVTTQVTTSAHLVIGTDTEGTSLSDIFPVG